jgi:F-type H+-transporting ATPase subunit c
VTLILGLAFIESLAIYALVVNLILLFANPTTDLLTAAAH